MEDIDLKPILYEANTVDFNNNGLGALTEAMFSQVTEERNGIFELSVVYPMSGKLYDKISEHMLLKVKPNKVDDPHVFRIYSLQIDSIAQTVSIDASTKSNELVNNLVKDLAIENTTPQVALDLMKQFLVLPTDYNFISDITSSNSTHWTNRNPLNCIAGEEGSLVDVFGGEIKRGNRTIWLYANRGVDNPNIIRHGKNLQGFTVEYSTKGMTTAILPYFNEKIEDSSETQMVYGDIVYSQYVNNYPFLYLVAMDYSSEEEVTDLATLNTKASQYFTEHNGIDKPSMSATVDMQDLSDSSEYKRFKSLENIQLCDTVTVYSKKHKVNLTAKVTKIIFDTLLEKNVSLELGSIRTSLTDSIKQGYTETIQDLQQNIYQTIETAANGKNRVFRGVEEPVTGMIKNDVWYKPVNDGEIEMYVFDGATWNKEAYSADSLGGTVNFANINAINLNLDALTTATITGANMWLNLVTGEMQFTDPVSGDTVVLDQGQIMFQNGLNIRHLKYSDEGLILEPSVSNTGTAGNTSLIMRGGDGSHKYIDGVNTTFNDREHHQRMTMINDVIRFHSWGGVEIRDNLYFDGRDVFNYIRAKAFLMGGSGSVGMYEDANSWTRIDGTNGVALYAGGQEILAAYKGSPNEVDIFGNVDLNGGTILNQSDIRLKTNIVDSSVDPFSVVEKMRFIEFEWDKTNPYNKDKPDGVQFGIEAQYSPFLAVKDNGSNYLSINMGKQVNLNSMVNQKMIAEIKSLKQELADLKTLLTEKGVI